MSKVRIYHGSRKIIEEPTYKGGKLHNDYGQGFYCTKHIELAKEWAVDENSNGFVNEYDIDLSGLKVLNLNDERYSILHWLTVLLEHRTMSMNGPVARDGMDYLVKKYHIDIDAYDVIIGYRADDSYFSFARAFISNTISVQQLENAMYLGELGEQYFLQSEEAFSKLKFLGAIPVECTEYFLAKNSRDTKARKEYEKIANSIDRNGIFLLDLIREEKENGTSL